MTANPVDSKCWSSGLYLNRNGSDMIVVFQTEPKGERLQFPSHSFVLSTKSPVIKAMLDDINFKRSPKKILLLDGVKLAAAENFFKYLYFEELPDLSWPHLVTMYQAAVTYQMLKLKDLCVQRLDESYTRDVTLNNVCRKYEETVEIGCSLPETRDPCLQLMAQGAQIIFANEYHLVLSAKALAVFLSLDHLNISDESVVLEGLWKWGEKQCGENDKSLTEENVKEEIEPFFSTIRWGYIADREDNLKGLVISERENPERKCTRSRKRQDRPSLLAKSGRFGVSKSEISAKSLEGLQLIGSFTFSRNVFLIGFRLKAFEYRPLTDREYRFGFDLGSSGIKLVSGKVTIEILTYCEPSTLLNIFVEFRPPFLMLAERKVRIWFDDIYFPYLFKSNETSLEPMELDLKDSQHTVTNVEDASPSLRDVFYIIVT